MNVDQDVDFRLRRPSNPEYGFPPIAVVASSGPWHLQTYWTSEQARQFAAELVAMAEEVES